MSKDEVQQQLKMMADQLKMTPDQRDKAKAILTDQAAQLKQMRTKYAGMPKTAENKEAMKKDMMALREDTDSKMSQVLSADQMTQYKAMREAQKAKMKQHMAEREKHEDNDKDKDADHK
jgi:septal ring factor EnvC (AmiA/AmiB activator)